MILPTTLLPAAGRRPAAESSPRIAAARGLSASSALALLLALAPSLSLAVPPGEVPLLSWCAASEECLSWSATAGATSYALYRGDAASLSRLATADTDSCRVGTFAGTTTGPLLRRGPLPDDGLEWYLVAARNVDGEGTVGAASDGPRQQSAWGDCCNELLFADDFTGADGSPWSSPWTVLADSAATADRLSGEGRWRPRLSPVGYTLARLSAPLGAAGERDVDVTYTVRFEAIASQGIGFYVRQNGGYCTADNTTPCAPAPAGAGYALFLHGGFLGTTGMELWKEEGGNEIQLAPPTALTIANGVRYRVRFRCTQSTPTTTFLGAKFWPEGSPEPATWQASLIDATPSLQGDAARGGLGVDSFFLQSGSCAFAAPSHAFLDDVEVRRFCNPMIAPATPVLLGSTYGFTEGPLWHGDRLLFSDITADQIRSLVPPGPDVVFRAPSGQANGLATDRNGDLLACEIANRRLTRTDAGGQVTVVADSYNGLPFNAPNDVAVRADGTLYLTDPEYLIAGPRFQPFLNLFRIPPGGSPVSEWGGVPGSNAPNGVVFSPDQRLLWLSDSAAGQLRIFDVAPSGSLALRPAPLVSGLNGPDGMCVDVAGNVYVGTWANDLRVYTPNGDLLGSWAFPTPGTNCSFGGADGRTLYVTARERLYRIAVPVPGITGRP